MTTPRNKPAQKQEPEIHLHGDIIVHTHQDGSAKANYDEFNVHVSEHQLLQAKVNEEKLVGMAAHESGSSPRMRFDTALEQLSTACDFLEDRINLLSHRTAPVRTTEDSPAFPGPSGFAVDSSSEVMRLMNSIWCRIQISGIRIDNICSELET